MASLTTSTALLRLTTLLTLLGVSVSGSSRVTSISPTSGSVAGATRLTIYGEEFSPDPFSFGAGNEDKGNLVYLRTEFNTIECDVLPYYSNKEKIVCDTRSVGEEGEYSIYVIVDGVPVESYCNCKYKYNNGNTPTINSITPTSGLPGTHVVIDGRIITDVYDPSKALEDEDEYENKKQILRIYWGNYQCDPFDPETDELYNISLDSVDSTDGTIECVPKGTFVASQRIAFLISDEYGRSWTDKDALLVSGKSKLYHFQSHADVLDVEPKVGSTQGGTILTITGQFFDESATIVRVGGVPCEIFNISSTVILCVTGAAPSTKALYPGERGLLYEVWKDSAVSVADAEWDTNATDYNHTFVLEGSSPAQHLFGEEDNFISRLTGFFVPPRTGEYEFLVRGDDVGELWGSLLGPSNLTKIAYHTSYTPNWRSKNSQVSERINLIGNQSYYFEVRHREYTGGDSIEVGVVFYDVPLNHANITDATNEVQDIVTSSTVELEQQTLTVEGATYETQEIYVEMPSCPTASNVSDECDTSGHYTLQFYDYVTGNINLTASAEELQSALNLATGSEDVTVTKTDEGLSATYLIVFHIPEENLPLLLVSLGDPDHVVTITRVSSFAPISLSSFRLVYDDIMSSELSSDSTAEEMQNALLDMFSVKCSTVGSVSGKYVQDYEGESTGIVDGEVIKDEEPYCDRWSVKNPFQIFYAGRTLKPGTSKTVDPYDVRHNSQLCFGHRGPIKNFIQFRIHWYDEEFNDRYNWQTATDWNLVASEDWTYTCVDFEALVKTTWVFAQAASGTPLMIERIRLFREEGQDFYIDNLFIGSTAPEYVREQRAARPNGIFVTDAAVTKQVYSFGISLTPAQCGYDFPLIGIVGATSQVNDSESMVYESASWPNDVSISVTRTVSATPPIGGTFDISMDGQVFEVSAQATADKLKELLQANLDIGSLDVFREGTCAGFSWEVEWTSKGGRQPLMEVNGSRLTGNEVSVNSERHAEGQLFMGPIPGEFLRVPHSTPQVEVIVNSIPSSCSGGQCTFEYSDDVTPKGLSSTPSNGSATNSTIITLTGSGFSANSVENNVTINDVVCDVTSSNETSISCSVGESVAGVFDVLVEVEGKGFAEYPNGPLTFQYEMGVTDISPTVGSEAGGTKVNITGYGFSEDISNVNVTVGGLPCLIKESSYDLIKCVISLDTQTTSRRRRRSAVTVDLVIVVNDNSITEEDSFSFDPSLTPTITAVSQNVSSVHGGDLLVISGSGFGDSGAEIQIGSAVCEVEVQTDTEINCTIPANSPGVYYIELTVIDQGFASVGIQFKYELEVSGMFPDQGSFQGGTVVTLTGVGFGSNASEVAVSMDDFACDITSVANDEIICETTTSERVHHVDNFGKHELYGLGYKWNPNVLTVIAGDIVVWQWAVQKHVSGIGYAVMQTANSDAVNYDGQGFISGARSTEGIFAYKFSAPGTYYYSSGPVDEDGQLYMKGTIKVEEPTSSTHKLVVEVAGFEALHDTMSGVSEPAASGSCPGDASVHSSCTVPKAVEEDDSSFYYAYWICSTPIITDISPNGGTPDQVINITGSGFSDVACENQISIGEYSCVTQTSTNISLTCLIDTEDTMSVGVPQAVSVVVKNRGLALNKISVPSKLGFTLKPQIDALSTHEGSLSGGTDITITGDGFAASSPEEVSVWIGNSGCLVQSVSYKEVVCSTTASNPAFAELTLQINSVWADCKGNCSFRFSDGLTPQVDDVSPDTVSGTSTSLIILGSGFVNDTMTINVTVGGIECEVTYAWEDEINCDVSYVPVGDQVVIVNIPGRGNAFFNTSNTVFSSKDIDSVTPSTGSTEGGQVITILGNGFVDGDTTVSVGGAACNIQSVTLSQIVCSTPAHSAGTVDLVVSSNGEEYPTQDYDYSSAVTPTITSVTPANGATGDSITISGSSFSTNTAEVSVTIDNVACTITSAAVDSIECDVGAHSAGTYPVVVYIEDKGLSADDAEFEYELRVDSVSPIEGSFGGGRVLTIDGAGYDDTAVVLVCNNTCPITNSSSSFIECDVPANSGSGDVLCDVVVTLSSGATVTKSDSFTYKTNLTPVIDSVEPRRGGTAGGTTLNITGSGFESSGNIVSIGGSECTIQSESTTEIICQTGPRSPPEMLKVRVEVGDNGIATQDNADFYYIDVWSSRYTWGNQDPPIEGDFVIVPAGQTLLLDVTTPILKMLLIQGGTLMFDEADIELHAENILIVDGGALQVGTEEEPFQHEATIMMHGHVRSQELPLFGAKTLAVRNGTLDLHGKYVPVTWTRLAQTAEAGATQLVLQQAVTWKAGDQIVIASTGHRHSQRENEDVFITDVSADGTVLTFEPALVYEHLGISQTIEGVNLEMRAEVGLLTHNVKFRGSVQEEWTETIEACPEEFDTNQFATQTCFLGRFGEETGSDQFGAQIMLFAKYQDQQLVKGRISYIEVTHAGQAFRLGRYPIHFHLNGDVTGSYVRGCGIHHTFNRAVTIHAVHNLLVEHNVAYNIMGHAYFLEDGIETGTIIQYNLGVFVRPSSSLLNVDITPATFWVTNPNNTVRHNAAAGGSHFGFWYNAPSHPEGPSFTTAICPRNVPLGEFQNNTAHAMGWYGLWIFPIYYPRVGGGCNSVEAEPAKYHSLYAWEVERGAEAVEVGAIQFHDFVFSDADKSGVEYQTIAAPWGEGGSLVRNLTVVAYSNISDPSECTSAGIHGPKGDGLTVDGAKLVNFDQSRCAGIRACAHCKTFQGGFSIRTQGLEFLNSPNKVGFQWEHECWIEDNDGTLSGNANYIVLPSNPNLHPDHCAEDASFGVGFPGSSCDTTIRLHRMAFNEPLPSSLLYKDTLFTNAYGTSRVPYKKKRLTHPQGWMLTLIDGDAYNFIFEDVDHVTNISYHATFYNYEDGDFSLLNHNFTQRPDKFATIGVIKNSTEEVPSYANDENGDWHWNNATRELTYIISGKGESNPVNRQVDLDVYQCFFKDCLIPVPEPPPVGRPGEALLWSEAASWEGVEDGWGGSDGNIPQDGANVMVLPEVWMVADVLLPIMNKLFIYGNLEIEDTQDNKIEATYILIQGGRLIIGFSESNPFVHDMKILLNGNHFTPDQPLPNGPNLGSKALGVFGGLDLHGVNRTVYWTQLSATVSPGDNTLTVVAETDWVVGDEIVVATTSYEAWQTETFIIVAVTDASTFQINGTFEFRHIAEFQDDYVLAAEVGLLTRNIKIEGNDYDLLFDESYGARVLVGRFFQSGTQYKGYARISNVQFFHTGQEGHSDFYDPRYSLAFLDIGEVDELAPSFVKGCSFHNGFSPAIGVFGTEGVLLKDNVVHHTVGPGIIVWEDNNEIIHNLITLVVFPGTYQDRFEPENLMWNAGIEVEKAGKVILINNTVAGSERVAFKIKGEKCYEAPNPLTDWYGNVGHSTLHGIHMHSISEPGCAKVSNFLIYKCWDYGVYHLVSSSVLLTDMKLIDNNIAVMPMVMTPPAISHVTSDKFVRIEKSLIVGVSDSFDCTADAVQPENAGQSSKQRAPRPPGGGHAGYVWGSFLSSSNGSPFKTFHGCNSYPMINGKSEIDDVVFRGFGTHCGKEDVAIMTNKKSEDGIHPMTTSGVTFEDVDEDRKIFIYRPNVGSVNPSDCVDMDCDGQKKAMIRDLDGTLLGSVGTVIAQSEFEWDGDSRRGLGDYRIPKVMLTNPDGSRILADDIAPNKGIYRGTNNECEYNSNWQAYKCHGIDHMMLIVESMDGDTEVRRLSPMAMYSDGYVDLINGPQDQGWCHGYTCQERISTFYTLIATGKEYEVYFTSTNPQTLRFHLLNSDDSQAVVIGIWYANPQRLDVYYQDRYVTPNNADFSSGEFTWKAKDPSLPADQYNPSVSSGIYGENYFDRDTQTLWMLIKGPVPIEIRTTAVIMVTFGVPAVSVDDFYEENLVRNLAGLLNIDESQIRIVDVVSEASGRRRRRAVEGETEVVVEIGPQPSPTIESPGSESSQNDTSATTPSPQTIPTSAPGTSLNFDQLVEIQSMLVDDLQSGSLGDSLNITITSMAMTDPVAEPVDPTGGVRATNETGGTSDVPNGTKTFSEVQLEEEEQLNAELEVDVVYRTPESLVIYTQPDGAKERAPFFEQPSIYAVDALGNMIDQLGHSSNPWQLTASLNPSSTSGQLSGNLTVSFMSGWANFTDLTMDLTVSGVILDFTVIKPNTSTLAVSSNAFDVAVRPYYLSALTAPDMVTENTTFEVIIELRDEITMMIPGDLMTKGLEWHAMMALNMPTNYIGQLTGQLETTFDLSTGQAHFTNLSIDAIGLSYILEVTVVTMPSSAYELTLLVDPFDVVSSQQMNYTGPIRRLKLQFLVDYDVVAAGKEAQLEIYVLNYFSARYTGVQISNVSLERGSILVSFDIQGDLDATQEEIWTDIQSGDIVLTFDGYTLTPDEYLQVDGETYGEVATTTAMPEVAAPIPIWAIIIIVVVVLLMIVIISFIVFKFCCGRGKKENMVEAEPLTEPNFKMKEFASSTSLENPMLKVHDEGQERSVFHDQNFNGRLTPNTPRRTPEIAVTALPPGFTESTGQQERILEDRVPMFIMVKNSDGTFQKLGSVKANKVGTMRDLRDDVKRALPAKLQEKKFILMQETLKDIDGAKEKKLVLSEVYRSDSILIRWVKDKDISKLCICGLVGQFECSLCRQQTYCSPQCQSTDWVRHSMQCSSYAVASVDGRV
ncbi:fibrocystin-L-like isoform X1 [Asterias amurensis]|uniref:fibrocystin-L-like isoform X1 n=1 Tax=Asterias amurensis TaxID=7602 RepID=UPI003AB26029